jgi:CO dehydrogenase nickel-insertion accessory protein CooC1
MIIFQPAAYKASLLRMQSGAMNGEGCQCFAAMMQRRIWLTTSPTEMKHVNV